MMRSAIAFALVAVTLCASVSALKTASIVMDPQFTGTGFYPGVGFTVYLDRTTVDVRLENALSSNSSLQLRVNNYVGPWIDQGVMSRYCDGCGRAAPGNVTLSVWDKYGMVWSVTTKFAPCAFVTVSVTGNMVRQNYQATYVQDPPKYYRASFFTQYTLPGAWYQDSDARDTEPGMTSVHLNVPMLAPVKYNGWPSPGTLVFANVSWSDTSDRDYETYMLFVNDTVPSPAGFQTVPFASSATIPNNNGFMSPGSIVAIGGFGFSTKAQYACVWNNTMNSQIVTGATVSPSSKALLNCPVPDSLTAASDYGDYIDLINIQLINNGGVQNLPPSLPFYTRNGGPPHWTVYPVPSSSSGLNGGQIFGIILAVLVGVALLGYGGYRLYLWKKGQAATSYEHFGDDRTQPGTTSQQIQYNPQAAATSSYQGTDETARPPATENM